LRHGGNRLKAMQQVLNEVMPALEAERKRLADA